MKALAFTLAVVVAGLAGCSGGTRSPLYNEREAAIPPGEGMLGDALTFDSSKRAANAPSAAQASAAEQEEFKKWRESAGQSERQEFEEWRAWQEWKRKNPK
jgi:uncharacterized protein YccT (UPF0319 family)